MSSKLYICARSSHYYWFINRYGLNRRQHVLLNKEAQLFGYRGNDINILMLASAGNLSSYGHITEQLRIRKLYPYRVPCEKINSKLIRHDTYGLCFVTYDDPRTKTMRVTPLIGDPVQSITVSYGKYTYVTS